MGKKARGRRSLVKKTLRVQGWYENELGEIKQRITKADARERLLHRKLLMRQAEKEIIDAMNKIARDEVTAVEDARFIESLNDAVKALEASP